MEPPGHRRAGVHRRGGHRAVRRPHPPRGGGPRPRHPERRRRVPHGVPARRRVAATSPEVLTDARAELLVVDGDGCGRVGHPDGTDDPVAVQAAGGVVLAAGGWAYNDALVDRHVPRILRVAWKLGTDHDDGWGLRCCLGVGAATEGMGAAEVALPITPPRTMVRGVLVNGLGPPLHQRGHLLRPRRPVGPDGTGRRGCTCWSTSPATRSTASACGPSGCAPTGTS